MFAVMMTDTQRILLSELVLKNMELGLTDDPILKLGVAIEVRKIRTRLKRSMGSEAYNRLITQGQRVYGISPARDLKLKVRG
jgi:hypothetical protein